MVETVVVSYMPAFIVGVIAVFYAAFLFLYQRYMDKKNNTKAQQVRMKECQDKMSELAKSPNAKDPKVAEEISQLQKETMSISMGMMKGQFKGMIWIMLIGLVILYIVNLFGYGAFPTGRFLGLTNVIVWFILVSLVVNILYKIMFSILDKKNMLETQ